MKTLVRQCRTWFFARHLGSQQQPESIVLASARGYGYNPDEMTLLWSDTDAETETVMLRMLREASGARRFAIANALTTSVIELSRRSLRREYPDASETEILLKWVGLHYGPELERELRDELERRGSR